LGLIWPRLGLASFPLQPMLGCLPPSHADLQNKRETGAAGEWQEDSEQRGIEDRERRQREGEDPEQKKGEQRERESRRRLAVVVPTVRRRPPRNPDPKKRRGGGQRRRCPTPSSLLPSSLPQPDASRNPTPSEPPRCSLCHRLPVTASTQCHPSCLAASTCC